MMWIAKVQEPDRDDEGKLIRDNDGNLVWGRAADGRTPATHACRPMAGAHAPIRGESVPPARIAPAALRTLQRTGPSGCVETYFTS
jgi:hypothetical protein